MGYPYPPARMAMNPHLWVFIYWPLRISIESFAQKQLVSKVLSKLPFVSKKKSQSFPLASYEACTSPL